MRSAIMYVYTYIYDTCSYIIVLLTCRSFLCSVESYIMSEHDLGDFLANVRASYDIWLREGGIAKLTHASVQGTLTGAINEVCM
jgi:hypothetical protein